ncbi:MAG: hypothetical protein WCV82_00470 [Candidatus Paceibacterota bacterium]
MKTTTNNPMKVLAIVMLLGLIVYGVGVAIRNPDLLENSSQRKAAVATSPTSGVVDIDDTQWKEVICLDNTKSVVGNLLTDDVWWQIRLDKDPAKVYTLYPRNWKEGTTNKLVTPPANVTEWRVMPGQAIKTGKVAWKIVPKA